MNRWKVRVTITGAQVSPESVSLRVLAGILSHLDKAIFAYALGKQLEVPEEAAPSLVEIETASEALVLSMPAPLMPAIAGISRAIDTKDYSDFTDSAYEELYGLSESVVRRGWGLEIHESPEHQISFARIAPQEPIAPPSAPHHVTGTTVIHGRCLRVGGAVQPKAEVRISSSGKLLNVNLSEDAAKDLAKQLYDEVVLEGTATWNTSAWEIVDFRVSQVTPYRKVDPKLAFKELASSAAGQWDGVDPIEFVSDIREKA